MTPLDLQTENRIRARRNEQTGLALSGWLGGVSVATAVLCGFVATTSKDTTAIVASSYLCLVFTLATLFMYHGTRRYISEHMAAYEAREKRNQKQARDNDNFKRRIIGGLERSAIHHINGDPTDNRTENLQMIPLTRGRAAGLTGTDPAAKILEWPRKG